MDIGLIMAVRNHPGSPYPLREVYEDYIGDCVHAERLGFDSVWVGEHHFSPDQWTPSVFPVLAAIAARTERVRLGPAVLCLPFHDPLRAAEDAAVVDIISNGRLELGVGVGSAPAEFETFGTPIAERSARSFEAIAFIERCFTEPEPFDHEGRYYRYPNVDFTTKPVQEHVPIWWGGMGPANVRRAARRGYHLLARSPFYDDALREAGRDPAGFGFSTMPTHIHIAPTRDQAWDEAEDGLHWHCTFYRARGIFPAGATPEGPLPELPPARELRHIEGFGFLPGDRFIIGTPDEVLEDLLAIEAGRLGRVTHLLCSMRGPGMRTPEVRRSMELFAKECLPHLR